MLSSFPHKRLQEGKMQQFQQGRFLRDRYREFLAEPFSTERVHVQSTDVDRTIMSAQLTLAGLFPPVGSEIWNRELSWQPVPVHYQPLSQDSVSTPLTLIEAGGNNDLVRPHIIKKMCTYSSKKYWD